MKNLNLNTSSEQGKVDSIESINNTLKQQIGTNLNIPEKGIKRDHEVFNEWFGTEPSREGLSYLQFMSNIALSEFNEKAKNYEWLIEIINNLRPDQADSLQIMYTHSKNSKPTKERKPIKYDIEDIKDQLIVWFDSRNPYYAAALHYLSEVSGGSIFQQTTSNIRIIFSNLKGKNITLLWQSYNIFHNTLEQRSATIDSKSNTTIKSLFQKEVLSSPMGKQLTNKLYDTMKGIGLFGKELDLYKGNSFGLVSLLYTLEKEDFNNVIQEIRNFYGVAKFQYLSYNEPKKKQGKPEDLKGRLQKLLSLSELSYYDPGEISRIGNGRKMPNLTNYDNMGDVPLANAPSVIQGYNATIPEKYQQKRISDIGED